MKLSVIVPVFRGASTIGPLLEKIREEIGDAYSYEVVFVDDCGPISPWNVIRGLKDKYPGLVKGVQLTRNFGQHNALIAGFQVAEGEWVRSSSMVTTYSPSAT